MHPRRFTIGLAIACLLAAGCVQILPAPVAPRPKPSAGAKTPVTPTEKSPAPTPIGAYTGVVLEPDGSPARGITVRGHIISSNGAGIISSNGAGYRLTQAGGTAAIPEVSTDEQGRFTLAHPDGQPLNLEAIKSDEFKAIQFEVPADATDVKLQLAPTGAISGKVKASVAQVTDFEGVDVFIPGTTYVAKASRDGSYAIANLPVGSFTLVATKTGLGRAEANGVKVESRTTTTAPELVLAVPAPQLTSLSPLNGGPGVDITITGENFGASTGKTFSVTLGGAAVTNPERLNDTTLRIKVPPLAVTGEVIVTVDGIPSGPLPFQVVKTLTFKNLAAAIPDQANFQVAVEARDTADAVIADPTLQFSVTGDAFTVDPTGKVTAKALGKATLKAASGAVEVTQEIAVHKPAAVAAFVAGQPDYKFIFEAKSGQGAAAAFRSVDTLVPDGTNGIYAFDIAQESYYPIIRHVTAGGNATVVKVPMHPTESPREPAGMDTDPTGKLYFLSESALFRRNADGTATLLAGKENTTGAVDGPGTLARFSGPRDLAVFGTDTLYVADRGNAAIRKVVIAGDGTVTVSTLAGGGGKGYADGEGTSAKFRVPSEIEVDDDGNLYVLDVEDYRLRMITPAGLVSSLVGSGAGGLDDGQGAAGQLKTNIWGHYPLAYHAGHVYLVHDGMLRRVATQGATKGTLTTVIAKGAAYASPDQSEIQFLTPFGMTIAPDGTLYMAAGQRIWKVSGFPAP